MASEAKLVSDLLAEFNTVVNTGFNKSYEQFEPELKKLGYKYPSGPVETVNFIFMGFLGGLERFYGSRKHDTIPEGYKFPVTNVEWDKAVDIERRKMIRAAAAGSAVGLTTYKNNIMALGPMAKDHPYEMMLDMLEVGDASTYGLTFDGQNMFDTTHDYAIVAGSQSNLLSGTGETVALVYADLIAAKAAMNGFYYQQGGTANSKKRKLNKTSNKLMVVCPDGLSSIFEAILGAEKIGNNTNLMKGKFQIVSRPFTDVDDWYLINLDDDGLGMSPFLLQMEEEPKLDNPQESDLSVRENGMYSWGVRYSGVQAYGAWWKAVMTTNT